MQLSDFHFDLPDELIARYPAATRSASRLLCVNGDDFMHRHFSDILDLIHPGDLLVFNDTKVIPARLIGQKTTGGRVEVLVERLIDDKRMYAQVRVSKAPKIGDKLLFADGFLLEVSGRVEAFYELSYHGTERSLLAAIEAIGLIPLPPYLHRTPDDSDKERYQTVYAKHKGSVAAPTAGFHFDDALLRRLREKQIQMDYLTLHIGAGTFTPIRVQRIDEHRMHTEYLEVSASLCEKIQATHAAGKRVIAVGTTTLRALETAISDGEVKPFRGETSIFIYPGHTFHSADVLITNLHLPSSTLLMLVCAFGGHTRMMNAYQEAVAKAYRFYSYGDAMWVPLARFN